MFSLGIYIVFYILEELFEKLSPSGPCVPGGGFLFTILVLPFLNLGLLGRNVYQLRRGNRSALISTIIHGTVSLIIISFFISVQF